MVSCPGTELYLALQEMFKEQSNTTIGMQVVMISKKVLPFAHNNARIIPRFKNPFWDLPRLQTVLKNRTGEATAITR